MTSLKFQGQIQRKGFDPLKLPDQVRRIQEETDRQVRGMEAVREAELRNRNEWLSAKKDKDNKEAIVRQKKFDFENEMAEAYRDAEMQHYKTRLADVSPGGARALEITLQEKADKEKENNWKKLASLSTTVMKQVAEIDQARGRKMMEYGAEIQTRFGLSPIELKAMQLQGQNIDWADAAIERVKHRLKLNGVGPEEIQAVLGLSGRAFLGAQESAISIAGTQGYSTWLREGREGAGEESVQIGNLPIPELNGRTLNEIRADGKGVNSGDMRIALRVLTGKYIAKLKQAGYEDTFLTAHLRPGVDKTNNEYLARQYTRDEKAVEANESKAFNDSLQGKLLGFGKTRVGEGVFEFWESKAGADPKRRAEIWRKTEGALSHFADIGLLDHEMLDDLENHMYARGKSNFDTDAVKDTRFGDSHAASISRIRDRINKRVDKAYRAKDARFKEYDAKTKSNVEAKLAASEHPFTMTDKEELDEEYRLKGYPIPTWTANLLIRDRMADAEGRAYLNRLATGGTKYSTGLPAAVLHSGLFSPNLIKEFDPLTNESKGIQSDLIKKFENSISSAISSKINAGHFKEDHAKSAAQWRGEARALNEFRRRIKEGILTGSHVDVYGLYQKTSVDLEKEIKDKTEGGTWDLARDDNGFVIKGEGAGWHYDKVTVHLDTVGQELRRKVTEDPSIINQPGFFPPDLHKRIERTPSGEPMPNAISQIKNGLGRKWSMDDVIDAARAADGLPELPRRGARGLENCIHPGIRELLTDRPGMAKTCRAIEKQGIKDGDEMAFLDNIVRFFTPNEVKAALKLPEKIDDAVTPLGSNSVTTAPELWNTSLEELSIAEAIKIPGGHLFGPMQTSTEELKVLVKEGAIDENAGLNIGTFNMIAIAGLDRETSEMRVPGQDGLPTAIPGVGRYFPPVAETELGKQKGTLIAHSLGVNYWRMIPGILEEVAV